MVAGATLLHSCTAMFNSMAYGSSDLYRTDNRVAVAERLRAEAEAEAAEAEARRAQWEARQAAAEAERAEAEYYASLRDEEPNFLNIVADDYQSAYARRLYGFQSPTYRLPSSYYNLLGNSALFYASAYDPAFYNVMVSGDQVWVEPRYITSMFGSWGAVNITFGLYSSPWTYGWSYRANPFYYSCWGYPRYSWYDWNWNICYNPWHSSWWDPWYYHYYPHYHHHGGYYPPQRPPQHRPGYNDPNHGRPGHNHVTGSGASSGRPNQNLNGDRGSTADRYTSPTTNRNYGNKDSNRRPVSGSTSQGIYQGSNTTVGGKSTISIGSSSSKPGGSTSTRVEVPTKGGSSVSTGSSSTGSNKGSASNFRQGTTSSRSTAVSGGKSSSSSSSTKVGGSTSSRRGTSVGSSSSNSSSSKSSSSYRSSSSSSRSSSSSSYRSSSSSSSRNSVTGYNASSSSRSSSGYSSGSSSGGGSRSGGGGSTSSRR